MSTHEHSRRAHELVDAIKDGYTPDRADVDFLRSFLPELPKQKTLEELIEHVNDVWGDTHVNEWDAGAHGVLEGWLSEFEVQLRGLVDAEPEIISAAVLTLPAGMRLADHEQYGRVVTSPKPNRDGIYDLLVPKPKFETGADWEYAHECELTFIDAEPAKSAHPEFLETEANYQNAPAGTVAAKDGWLAWIKQKNGDWSCDGGSEGGSILAQTGKRRVLRWGWTNE